MWRAAAGRWRKGKDTWFGDLLRPWEEWRSCCECAAFVWSARGTPRGSPTLPSRFLVSWPPQRRMPGFQHALLQFQPYPKRGLPCSRICSGSLPRLSYGGPPSTVTLASVSESLPSSLPGMSLLLVFTLPTPNILPSLQVHGAHLTSEKPLEGTLFHIAQPHPSCAHWDQQQLQPMPFIKHFLSARHGAKLLTCENLFNSCYDPGKEAFLPPSCRWGNRLGG